MAIVVHGATSFLGGALVDRYVSMGERLFGFGGSPEKIEQLKIQYPEASFMCVDYEDLEATSQHAADFCCTTDIKSLVILNGMHGIRPFSRLSPDILLAFLKANVMYPAEVIRALLKSNSNGSLKSIVLVGSIAALKGQKGLSAYATSKAALMGLVRSLAAEYGHRGLRINMISPGFIDSPVGRDVSSRTRAIEEITSEYPLGLGSTEDFVNQVQFLIDDKSRWVTGQNIVIDGGFSV